MSRMSNLHAETASDRADAAEHEVERLRAEIRDARHRVAVATGILANGGHPNREVLLRLNLAIEVLREAAPPVLPRLPAETCDDVDF